MGKRKRKRKRRKRRKRFYLSINFQMDYEKLSKLLYPPPLTAPAFLTASQESFSVAQWIKSFSDEQQVMTIIFFPLLELVSLSSLVSSQTRSSQQQSRERKHIFWLSELSEDEKGRRRLGAERCFGCGEWKMKVWSQIMGVCVSEFRSSRSLEDAGEGNSQIIQPFVCDVLPGDILRTMDICDIQILSEKIKKKEQRHEGKTNWIEDKRREKRMGMLELSSVEKFISEILSFSCWEDSWIFSLVFGSILITNSWGLCPKLKKALLISRSDAWIIHLMTFPFPLSLHTASTSSLKLITKILRMLSIAHRPVVECVRWLIALMMIEWSGAEHKQKHTRKKQKSWSENFSQPHTKKI